MPRKTSLSNSNRDIDNKISNNNIGHHNQFDSISNRRQTRNNSRSSHDQRQDLLDNDHDSVMVEDGIQDSGDNWQDEVEEGDEDEDDEDEEESLRRLSERYQKSRSASYLMDHSDDDDDDDEEEDTSNIVINDDESQQDSDNDYNYDSEGDELMRSVEGALNRSTQRRTREQRYAITDEEFFDELLGGRLSRGGRHQRRQDDEEEEEEEEEDDDDEDEDQFHETQEDEQDEDDDTAHATDRRTAILNRIASASPSSPQAASRNNLMGNSLTDSIGRLFPESMSGFFTASGLGGAFSISNLVEGLKRRDDPYLILETLNELSEKILMMNGVVAERSIPVYKLSQNLIDILQDPMLQEDLELQLVTCRCMYNVLLVNNEFANEMVSCGAIEALKSKLFEISFIDLAEQALQTLEMISNVRGRDLMSKNCMHSVLEYLDFFTIHSQRKALIITANACQNVSLDNFDKVKEIFPIIERVATEYSDAISVENSWIAISRVIQSFKKNPELLEELISSDLLKRLSLIIPASCGKKNSSNSLLTFATSLKILNSLTILANISSQLSIKILNDFKLGDVIATSLGNYSNISLNSSESAQDDSIAKVSIESLMAAPKELILSFIRLIGITLPYVIASPQSKTIYEITIGGFMSLEDNQTRKKLREEKIKLYDENQEIITNFVEKILPLLINIYSSTVDYEIRRILLVDLFRLLDLVSDKVAPGLILESNVTTLLASIVFQSKTFIRRELSSLHTDREKLRSLILKRSAGCHFYILLMGAFLITRRLSKKPEYMKEFEREGLLEDTAILLDVLKEDGSLVINYQKEQSMNMRNPFDDNNDENEDERMQTQMTDEDDDDDDDDEEEGEGEEEEEEEEEEYDENDEEEEDIAETQASMGGISFRYASLYRSYDDNAFWVDALNVISLPDIITELINIASDTQEQHLYFKANGADGRLEHMKLLDKLVDKISDLDQLLKYTYADWLQIWKLFTEALGGTINKNNTISSFELISCGVIETLLALFRSDIGYEGGPCYVTFQKIFCEIFSHKADQTELPIILLVTKLQEALTRSELFEIATSGTSNSLSYGSIHGGSSDNNSSRAAVMAKQIRLRLNCDDNSMPEGTRQMLMTVHALGTFQGIHTFLKTRVQTLSLLTRLGDIASARAEIARRQDQSDENGNRNYYIEFLIDGEVIPDGTTIYGAVYRSLQKDSNHTVDPRLVWSGTHEITFRKVYGEKPSDDDSGEWYPHDSAIDELEVLQDLTTINILDLLKILFDMNRTLTTSGVSAALFINFKLTAKLNRQLEEPLVVSSGTLPGWSIYITRNFPFLFPIETRMFFLQSTSFGHSRLIQLWDHRTNQTESGNQHQANLASLGRPSRHKIRISRKKLFECALKVLKNYASIPSLIEIEYFDEEGTGLGPTLEFYANTSKEFSLKKRHMWREDDDFSNKYVNYKTGLFPAPIDGYLSDGSTKPAILTSFSLLGSFIARALLDSRIIDFNFNPLFFEIAKKLADPEANEISSYSNNKYSMLQDVKLVDPDLYKSLKHLLKYVEQYSDTINNDEVLVDDCTLEDLSLTFTLPGYHDIELTPNGHDIAVESRNIEDYIDQVIDLTVGKGVRSQIEAFTEGFSKVFPYYSMTIFSPEELVTLFGNGEEDWSLEVLQSSVRADHGYNSDSIAIKNLLEIMTNFDKEERRKFLQFLTGSPRLPIGGFKSLRPDLTVVRKQSEEGSTLDHYLPSVMTCANYLKLPDYSSKEIMKQRLVQAFNEGSDSFLLS